MIREILILLWILVIPLAITTRQLFQKYTSFLAHKENFSLSKKQSSELWGVIEHLFIIIIIVPFCIISESKEPFSQYNVLTGILAGEVIAFDLAVLAFHFEVEKNFLKKLFMFLFTFINFWTNALLVIQRQLSLTILWISVVAYLIFGINSITSRYLERGKTK